MMDKELSKILFGISGEFANSQAKVRADRACDKANTHDPMTALIEEGRNGWTTEEIVEELQALVSDDPETS